MSQSTPEANSHGPAQAELSPELAASLGLSSAQGDKVPAESAIVPSDQLKPEEIATLSLEQRDGQPLIIVSGGPYLPAAIKVVDASGEPVAAYRMWSAYPVEGHVFPNRWDPNPVNPVPDSRY